MPAAAVVHPRFEVDPDRPWRGIGPIQSAALAGRLSAETAGALADAESGPRGGLLPLPVDGADPTVRTVVDIRLPTAPRRNPFSTVSRACQTAR